MMAVTERLDPQELHVTKYRRFSPLLRSVSGERQVLQVTYSTMYRRRTFSICFCWKRPLMTRRRDPSTEPDVPNSANKNWVTCSSERFILLAISAMFAKMVYYYVSKCEFLVIDEHAFLLPSRRHCGGGILYDLVPEEARSGWVEWRRVKKRLSSKLYDIGFVSLCCQIPVPLIGSPC